MAARPIDIQFYVEHSFSSRTKSYCGVIVVQNPIRSSYNDVTLWIAARCIYTVGWQINSLVTPYYITERINEYFVNFMQITNRHIDQDDPMFVGNHRQPVNDMV